mmetsp:Transcript_61981/g.139547  ORF Transcript_61981/g.139547 Transcript_61981/m.139547 type:complete len:599 (-) Transcript_61981:1062-2858(-)
MHDDVALAALEATTARRSASCPIAPLGQHAMLRLDGAAHRGLMQRPLARCAVRGGLLVDRALAVLLANLAVESALGPILPLTEQAISPVGIVVAALLGLDQGARARLDTLLVVQRGFSSPLAQLGGRVRCRPCAPLCELAIDGGARLAVLRGLAHAQVHLGSHAPRAILQGEEGFVRRLGERQSPAAHRCAGAATPQLTAQGSGPLRPCAEVIRLALPSAFGDLLGTLEVAHPAARIGHLLDGAVPVPLAGATRAIAPLRPLVPLAIEAVLVRASLRVARGRDAERVAACRATALRWRDDLAAPLTLASAAWLRASGPLAPLAQLAVRGDITEAGRAGAVAHTGRARARLLQRLAAPLARTGGGHLDVARTLLGAEASACASRPLAPLGDLAVRVAEACARSLVACLVLVADARWRPSTVVGLGRHGPASRGIRPTTSRGARRPRAPRAPSAVETLLATGMSVARRGLALRQGLALRSSVLRADLDRPVPVHRPSAARGCAGGPHGPLAPSAVSHGARALRAHAGVDLLCRPLTTVAVELVRVLDGSLACHAALTAVHRASGPVRPLLEHAVNAARVGVARLQLLQGAARASTAVLRL